jgi:DNA-binding FadR family transcriptional regulator
LIVVDSFPSVQDRHVEVLDEAGRVRTPKLADVVARQIRAQITSRELLEGDPLPSESELMERFGVSRPTLREAMRILEAEQLVTFQRGAKRGAFITKPDLEVVTRQLGMVLGFSNATLADVYLARSILEPAAARRLAQRWTSEDLERLRLLHKQGEDAEEQPGRFAACAWAFHQAVCELSGNKTLSILATVLTNLSEAVYVNASQSNRLRSGVSEAEMRKRFSNANRAHADLIACVEAGDSTAAEKLWSEHLAELEEHVAERLGVEVFSR